MGKELISQQEPISQGWRDIDAICFSLAGGAIASIGTIVEMRIFSQKSIDFEAAIRLGGATAMGAGLGVKGAATIFSRLSSIINNRK